MRGFEYAGHAWMPRRSCSPNEAAPPPQQLYTICQRRSEARPCILSSTHNFSCNSRLFFLAPYLLYKQYDVHIKTRHNVSELRHLRSAYNFRHLHFMEIMSARTPKPNSLLTVQRYTNEAERQKSLFNIILLFPLGSERVKMYICAVLRHPKYQLGCCKIRTYVESRPLFCVRTSSISHALSKEGSGDVLLIEICQIALGSSAPMLTLPA